jgi:hypothetical protein
MAAPAHSAKQVPTGVEVWDGVGTQLAFAARPKTNFWEVTLKPLSLEGGEPINNTTLLNTVWRTKRAPVLKECPPMSGTAKYDPDVWPDLIALINKEGSVTQYWPDNSYADVFAYLRNFVYQDHKEKELPIANIEIVVTNWDPVGHVESGPVYTPASGT